jgi:predicted O-methyltransferase YrrM
VSKFFQFKSYITHWLDRVDDHSVHSPFYFDFYNKVIKGQQKDEEFNRIEDTRKRLLKNHSLIHVNDLGAKSPHFKSNEREVAQVAATSLAPKEYCELYVRIIHYLEAERIIELGTSLGITSLYLSSKKDAEVFTFEGNQDSIHIAKVNFDSFERKNIRIIEGNLDSTLSNFLQDPAKIDFAFVDANHKYEPTMRYFNMLSRRMTDAGIMVIDDIHLSVEMEKAWVEMKNYDLVYGSIDLYKCGILLFDLALTRKHFVWTL